ncbi:MAG: DUF6920 family protein [Steroidobacteraceae bacterium]
MRVELRLAGRLQKAGHASEPFEATHTIDIQKVGFASHATLGRTRAIIVSDALAENFIQGHRSSSVVFLHRRQEQAKRRLHEYAIRYLLSLPWVPDAIVCNGALRWTVSNKYTLRVRARVAELAAEVVLQLDRDGLIRSACALKLTAEGDTVTIDGAWRVRFSSYQSHAGQMIPLGCECVYGPRVGDVHVYKINVTDRSVY